MELTTGTPTAKAPAERFTGDGTGDGTTWLEPVTDRQYIAALAAT